MKITFFQPNRQQLISLQIWLNSLVDQSYLPLTHWTASSISADISIIPKSIYTLSKNVSVLSPSDEICFQPTTPLTLVLTRHCQWSKKDKRTVLDNRQEQYNRRFLAALGRQYQMPRFSKCLKLNLLEEGGDDDGNCTRTGMLSYWKQLEVNLNISKWFPIVTA